MEVHYPSNEYKNIISSSRNDISKTNISCPETILENTSTTHTASLEENVYVIEPEMPLPISNLQQALNQFWSQYVKALESEVTKLGSEVERLPGGLQQRLTLEALQNAKLLQLDDYRGTVLPNGSPLHMKPRDALNEVMCPCVEECEGRRRMKCATRRCDDCPEYKVHPLEQTNDALAPSVKFQTYELVTRCSKHGALEYGAKVCEKCEQKASAKDGKIGTRKELVLKEKSIGDSLTDHYIPELDKYAYHYAHVRMLSKKFCEKMRKDMFESIPYSLKTRRDYAEAIQEEMDHEIQSSHFRAKRTLSIEGCVVESYETETMRKKEFHSHFSDDCTQNAATTYQNMLVLLDFLEGEHALVRDLTIMFDHTDGCTAQYRCGIALYLLSILACKKKIIIDRAIEAPGHGKDEVDGVNATTKRFIRSKFCTVQAPGQ